MTGNIRSQEGAVNFAREVYTTICSMLQISDVRARELRFDRGKPL